MMGWDEASIWLTGAGGIEVGGIKVGERICEGRTGYAADTRFRSLLVVE